MGKSSSLHKQLRPSAIVFTSDSESSTEQEETSKPESIDDKTGDIQCKIDKKKQLAFP
jgi:hypothetical protein